MGSGNRGPGQPSRGDSRKHRRRHRILKLARSLLLFRLRPAAYNQRGGGRSPVQFGIWLGVRAVLALWIASSQGSLQ